MKKLLLLPALCMLYSAANAATYTVNSLAATNTGSGTSGTLRYCITQANLTAGPHTINFSVAGTIAIGSNANVLPALNTSGTTIDGTTVPGYSGYPLIVIDGTGTSSGNGLGINASGCFILGIEVRYAANAGINVTSSGNGFHIGSATGGCVIRNCNYYGIRLNNVSNGFIEGCRIGVDSAGLTCQMNQYDGIDIQGGGSNQIIGNHIACNGYNGIQIGGSNGNIIKGNTIGPLMGSCTFNGYRGVDIEGGSSNNIIGGTGPNEGNKIAGNDYWGIEVKDAGSIGNIISGNSMSCNAYDAIDVNTGGNNNIIPPTITVANATTVSGTSTPNAVIEVFRSQLAATFGCAGTPNTQGADYLGTTTANGSGAWSLSGTFSGAVTATQRTATDGSSKYSAIMNTGVTATWTNGCSGPIFGSGSAPAANFSMNSDTVCAGECIDFTDLSSNTPTSWSWTFSGGIPATSTLQDPTVCFSTAGNYTAQLAATNGVGTGNTTKNIVVLALPLISISQNANLLAATTGHPSYQWFLNGNLIGGATGDTLIITTNGNYTWAVTGANGCSDTSAVFTVTNMSVTDMDLSMVRLYPNPAHNQITLQLGITSSLFNRVEILNVAGQTLLTEVVKSSSVTIDVQSLPAGMYVLRMYGNVIHVMKFSKE